MSDLLYDLEKEFLTRHVENVHSVVAVDNIAGYGYVNEPTTSAVAIENGIGFGIGASGTKQLRQAGDTAGQEIVLPDGTRRLRIATSIAAANAPMIHIGGVVGVGWQFPLTGEGAVDEIEFDFSTRNEAVDVGNVIYLTYDACDADDWLWLQAFGRSE